MIVRVRGRISQSYPVGFYWDKNAPDTANDAKITIEKRGPKEYMVKFEPLSGGIYRTSALPYNEKIGPGERLETSADLINDFLTRIDTLGFISGDDLLNPLPSGGPTIIISDDNGKPVTGLTKDKFVEYFADKKGISDKTKPIGFYEIIQDPFFPRPPDIPGDYFSIWKEWVDKKKTEKEENDKKKIEEKPVDPPVSATQSSEPKIKLSINLPKGNFKEKIDLPEFTILVGDPVSDFTFVDGANQVDSEYTESAFSGKEEEAIILKNEVTDNPTGPNPEELAEEKAASGGGGLPPKSVPGPGPLAGSKLLYTSSYKGTTNYYLFNASNGLAGHRLKLILTDLASYLNSNGYKGTTLKNNGVMRDLMASTYPDSPLRAVASLHGAGLAIDLAFSIPGFKWSGIGDNKNLAASSDLTQKIMNWVKSQGDITWGAQWGKGSNPGSGIVNARGIDEYHHFEIKSDKISQYWEPFKSELSALGFDYTKLNTTGKGSKMYELNKKLLASAGVSA